MRPDDLDSYDSPVARLALARRSLAVVVVCAGARRRGPGRGVTVGALLAQEMLGGDASPASRRAVHARVRATALWSAGCRNAGTTGRPAPASSPGARRGSASCRCGRRACPALRVAVRVRRGHGDQPAGPLRRHRPRAAASRGTAVSVAMVSTTIGAVAGPISWSRSAGSRRRSASPHWPGRSCSPPPPTLLAALVLFVFCCGRTRSWWRGWSPPLRRARTCRRIAWRRLPTRCTAAASGRRHRDGADPGGDGRDHDDDAGAHARTTTVRSARSAS